MEGAFSRFPLASLLVLALGLRLWASPAAAPGTPVLAAAVAEELEDSDKPAVPAPVAADSSQKQPVPAAAPPAPADPALPPAAAALADSVRPGADSARQSADSSTVPAAQAPVSPPAYDSGQAAAGAPADGPGDLTIEVDESLSRNEGKSLPLALLYSALLPGTGDLYLQEKEKAKTFLLVEAGFWASLYVAWVAKESYLQSARNHASQYAGINANSKSENFLETMAAFRSYQEKQHRQDSYELAQVLSGKREQDYDIKPLPENYWDFGSSANPENTQAWREFQSTLRYYRASKVAMSFALGALALNRLASMVNTLQTYKRTSASRASWDLIPDLGPRHAGTQLTLRF